MIDLVDEILEGELSEAKLTLENRLEELFYQKLEELKSKVAKEFDVVSIAEAGVYKMGREKDIRIRIRRGKLQRNVIKSATAGYVYRGGKLVRMTPMERRHRRMAARTAKYKRRQGMQQSIRKRKVALRRRKALGV
jgi:hypothetical protein